MQIGGGLGKRGARKGGGKVPVGGSESSSQLLKRELKNRRQRGHWGKTSCRRKKGCSLRNRTGAEIARGRPGEQGGKRKRKERKRKIVSRAIIECRGLDKSTRIEKTRKRGAQLYHLRVNEQERRSRGKAYGLGDCPSRSRKKRWEQNGGRIRPPLAQETEHIVRIKRRSGGVEEKKKREPVTKRGFVRRTKDSMSRVNQIASTSRPTNSRLRR